MSDTAPRARRLLGACTIVCLTLGVLIGVAPAADADNRPALKLTSTVTGTSADIVGTVNRGTHQIGSASCTLDGTAVDCGAPSAAGKKAATYDVSLTGLSPGEHTFAITISLTDGGQVTGSTDVEVVTAQTFAEACAAQGGAVVPHLNGEVCTQVTGDPTQVHAACTTEGGTIEGGGIFCVNGTSQLMAASCNSDLPGSTSTIDPDQFQCLTPDPSTAISDQIAAYCSQLGGVFRAAEVIGPGGGGFLEYDCLSPA